MLIEKYTETLTNPLLPEAFQFLKRKDTFAIDYEHQQIGVCNKSEGFSLYTFEKELLWEINKPIVGALLAIERQQIWLAQRHDAQHSPYGCMTCKGRLWRLYLWTTKSTMLI